MSLLFKFSPVKGGARTRFRLAPTKIARVRAAARTMPRRCRLATPGCQDGRANRTTPRAALASRWAAISSSSSSGGSPRIARCRAAWAEQDRDQQRLLLAGRGEFGGDPLLRQTDGEIGAMRADRGSAGLPIARSICSERLCELGPRRPAPAFRRANPRQCRPAPVGRGETAPSDCGASAVEPLVRCHVGRPRPRHPAAAITSSRAASHAVVGGAVPQQARALAQCLLIAQQLARHAPGSSPSTSRSRNRRRPPGPSTKSRSIAGVSHTTLSRSPSAAWLRTGSPSIRTTRRSLAV